MYSITLVNSVFKCGAISDGATTNFVNPSYPTQDSNEGQSTIHDDICTFLLKIPESSAEICQVRWCSLYFVCVLFQLYLKYTFAL